ncbi:hypothetical protein AB836_00490 [Rickettsiales bacterium (ex Bugula neritina AB1)]|nr:hypothetical protein AB836_00490 [Rickettsiales bacterium (ex Bugula neritina AB1)]
MTVEIDKNDKNISKFRNICIIAHVDHGKTTLVDNLRKASKSHSDKEEASMDQGLEEKRGITILAKTTSFMYDDCHINIVDTPGHADFGGEVERIFNMIDTSILLVDAAEGVMPQTEFVVKKAILNKKKIIVIINKIDKKDARCEEVENEIFELLINSGYEQEPIFLYGSGREGFICKDLKIALSIQEHPEKKNMKDLLDVIKKSSPPKVLEGNDFIFSVNLIDSDKYFGKIVIGKIYSGVVNEGDTISVLDKNKDVKDTFRVLKIFKFVGITKIPVSSAEKGDIIGIAGSKIATVNHTLTNNVHIEPITGIEIDPPTMSVDVLPNISPFKGKDGMLGKMTFNAIRERLIEEAHKNVAIRLEEITGRESLTLYGRGELQLGVIFETMRQEGFEFCVSQPKILFKEDKSEPVEKVIIDLDDQYMGVVIEKMRKRKGQHTNTTEFLGKTRLEFIIPTRFIMGFQNEFISLTRGTGVMNRSFIGYEPFYGDIESNENGFLIATEEGSVTFYALNKLSVGVFYVEPGNSVYKGMVVGENNKQNDLMVNVAKAKELTNVRSAGKEDTVTLPPPSIVTIENGMTKLRDKQYLEITPKRICIFYVK